MFQIDPLSRQPVYEQLIKQLEEFVLAGLLTPDTQLPSVRSLSLELTINPNTIQKAYSDLDARGIIYSVPGIGCFVAKDALARLQVHMRHRLDELQVLAADLALAGISEEEMINRIRTVCRERGANV